MVTEFIDGIKVSAVDELARQKYDLADVNTKLFLTFGEQIFQSGFVHADPHPGNGNFFMLLLRNQFFAKIEFWLYFQFWSKIIILKLK